MPVRKHLYSRCNKCIIKAVARRHRNGEIYIKKIIALTLAAVAVLAFSSCGKKDTPDTTQDTVADTVVTDEATEADTVADDTADTTVSEEETAETTDNGLDFSTETEYVVFTVARSYKLESDAWLGVIPTGTIYQNEVDADEKDIVYCYCENLDDEAADTYRFAFEKDYILGIEDGSYDMVLCSSDNEETGKVLFQIGLEKNGENLKLDFENKN